MESLTPETIAKISKNFQRHGFDLKIFTTSAEAVTYLQTTIQGKTVGFGDSQTLWHMDLFHILSQQNNVADPMHPLPNETFKEAGRRCLNRDVFISSVNALTEDGYLVNVDGSGNRVAGTLFSANEVYFVCGINKLCPDIDSAIYRTRNFAAPKNTRRKQLRTPCAKLEPRCYDCSSIDRICNALVVYYHKMRNVEKMEIILIQEELGF